MAKTLLMLRKYWFVPVIGLLIINSWVAFYRLMGPGKKYMAYERISEFASNLRVQEQTAELEKSRKPGTHDYFNRYRVILLSLNAPSIESIALDDSVFALFHPRFHYYLNTLLYSDQASWNRFKLGDLTDAEFHQLISHFQSGWQRLFFWSERYKTTQDIYARYRAMLQKPEIKAYLYHATSPDSTLVVSYRATSMKDKLQLGGIPAKDIPSSSFLIQSSSTGMAVWIAQLMFLIVACIFLWRAIWIVGRISWLEFLFLATAYFPSNLFTGNLFGESLLAGAPHLLLWFTIALIWQIPSPISNKKIWTWLFIIGTAFILINKGLGLVTIAFYPLLLGLFVVQLVRQKGLRRKVMGRWLSLGFMPLAMYLVIIVGLILGFNYLAVPLMKYWQIQSSWFFNQGLVYSLSFDYWVFNIVIGILIIIFASIPGGFILGMLEFPLRIYYRLRKGLSALVAFGAYLSVIVFYAAYNDKLLTRNFFVMFFLVVVGILLSWLVMKLFRFIDPVHHDERKALRKLLEESFGHNEEKAYFEYYRNYLAKLYPRTRVALAMEGCELGLEGFLAPSPEQLTAIPVGNYFNLDLARFDRHPAAKAFPEWIPPKRRWGKKKNADSNEDSKLKEVRLYYPITDSNGNHSGYLYLAESGKLYWDAENAGFIAETVKIFNSFLNNILLGISYREEQLKLKLEQHERIMNEQLALEREKRNQELQEINRRIMDSINYASLIQRSILPKDDALSQYLKDYFIIWKPRDVVGGDYYWFHPFPGQNRYLLAVIDCTGHGVPGAFMTLMTNSILNSIVRDRGISQPDEIIRLLHQEVRYTLQQGHSESMKDGLDISLLLVDRDKAELSFAGAVHKALLYSQDVESAQPKVLSGVRYSLGGTREEINPELETHSYQAGDLIYLVTDGILDQPVMQDGILKRRIFQDWLQLFEGFAKTDFNQQQQAWDSFLQNLVSHSEQRDDITLFGLKL